MSYSAVWVGAQTYTLGRNLLSPQKAEERSFSQLVVLRRQEPRFPSSPTSVCRQIDHKGPPRCKLHPPAAPRRNPEPRLDLRTDSSPEDCSGSQASSSGRQDAEAGHQLRRVACAKPHQDSRASDGKPSV
ncbi:hypothetical protein MHYP_G00013340 [Metynnis hypsauchen]